MSKELEALEDIILYLNASESKGLYCKNIEVIKNALKNYDKLSKLKDLEDQIGCPLDFVTAPYKLSGLKKIWYHNQWCEVVRIVVYEEATKPYMEVRCKGYKYLKMILLEDYGKTWFLTEKGVLQ